MTRNSHTSLYRPHEGRWFAGVAIGLAQRLGFPVWTVRLAFLVLLPAGGVAIPLYAAGWLLIPGEGETESIAQGWTGNRSARRWVGVILIGLAVIVLVSETGLVRGDLVFALVLLGIGVLLYRGDLSSDGPRSPEPGTLPQAAPAEIADDPAVGPPSSPPARAPAAPPRDRSYLGRATTGIGLVALGILGFLEAVVPGFDPVARHYTALVLAIAGLGLVVGAWFGRTRGLVALSILLLPVALLTSVEVGFTDFADDRHHRPVDVDQMGDTYRLGLGTLVLDLREVDFAGRTVDLDAEVGMGELRIHLPRDVAAQITGRVGIGVFDIWDPTGTTSRGGMGIATEYTVEGDNGLLLLDAEMGIGQIEVRVEPEIVSSGEWINSSYRITDGDYLADEYSADGGVVSFDLRGLWLQEDRDVVVSLEFGEVSVMMPADIPYQVSARVEQGQLLFFGRNASGNDLYAERAAGSWGEPQLTLDIRVGEGTVSVEAER